MAEETHNITINRNSGVVTIDGRGYHAHELTYKHGYVDKTEILIIHAQNGDTYRFQTAKKTLFKGFGKVGKTINWFLGDFHNLKVASMRTKCLEEIKTGNIPHIKAPDDILLKKDEYVVKRDENVRFCQEKTKTTYYGGSIRIKVTKSISLGGGKGIPIQKEFIATLDTGQLTLTSKRLIFSGERKSSTAYLSEIAVIKQYSDAIALTKENAEKKIIFAGIDCELYAVLIKQLVQEE